MATKHREIEASHWGKKPGLELLDVRDLMGVM